MANDAVVFPRKLKILAINKIEIKRIFPLSRFRQYEIVGELRSAAVKIKRLEQCREELTQMVQELMGSKS